jgi:hypothetical protein
VIKKTYDPSPFNITDVIAYSPRHLTSRIAAQKGCFTAHPVAHSMVRDYKSGSLLKLLIAPEFRDKIRYQLEQFGTTRAALFPDLDGIAAHLNEMGYPAPD